MEKLLDGAEVEWKALGDVTQKWYSGGTPTAGNPEYYEAGNIPWLRTQEVKFSDIESTEVKVTQAALDNSSAKWIPSNCVIVAISGATAGRSAINKIPLTTNQHCGCLEIDSTQALYRYVYHWVCYNYQNIKALGQGARGDLNSSIIKSFKIPIPCPENPKKSLEIQAEIVRILDAFTELTSELIAELNARKKQYNYYRDQLLNFEEGEVEWKTLGEVAGFRRGTAITKKQTTIGDIPVVANGPRPTYFHGEINREGETIVIARSGAYAGYVSYWNQPIFLTDAFSVHPDSSILKPKFIFHLLQNKQDHIHGMKKGAGVPHVRVKEFESYLVPVPSLAEQSRIVTILDKFDALANSISEGLPREITLRQKQYEYYRDFLLSFPKPDAEVAA
jgi:type I restriction enzyme S subunit